MLGRTETILLTTERATAMPYLMDIGYFLLGYRVGDEDITLLNLRSV